MWRIFRRLIICVVGITILLSTVAIISRKNIRRQEEEFKNYVDSNYIKYYQILVDYTNRINNYDEEVYDELIKGIHKEDILSKATYKNALSYYYIIKGDYEKYDELVKESIMDYKKNKYSAPLQLQTYAYMINNEIANNKYNKALEYSYEAMELLDSEESKYIKKYLKDNFRVIINCNFVNIFVNNNLPNQAKKYCEKISCYKECKGIYKENEKNITFSQLIYNDSIGNYDETIKLAREYYNMVKESGAQNVEGLRSNIGKALVRDGLHEEALGHILAAKKFYEDNQKMGQAANVYIIYGEYFEAKKEYNSALEYYIKAYEIYEEQNKVEQQKETVIYINRVSKKSESNVDISKYLEGYIGISLNEDMQTGVTDLFQTIENINKKSYQSSLLEREHEKQRIQNASKDRILFIILLLSSIILLFFILVTLKKEIESEKSYEKELKNTINKDFLTKCYSRSYGIDTIETLADKNKKFSIALIDIDNFKNINDTYGHLVGDEVLKLVGSILNNKCKEVITSSRYGGEEFLVIFECNKEDAICILEEIRADIEKSSFVNNLTVTISAGLIEHEESTVEKNIEVVDMLLYDAKTKGKNRISVK